MSANDEGEQDREEARDGGEAAAAEATAPAPGGGDDENRDQHQPPLPSGDVEEGREERKSGPPDISNLHSVKIDNLSFDLSQEEITDMFSPYGEIGDVYVPRNHYTQRMRGFAFVRYVEKQSADAAIDAMHEKEIAGRVIRVGMAEEKKPDTRGPYHSRDRGYYRGDRGGGYNNNRRDYYRGGGYGGGGDRYRDRRNDSGHDRRDGGYYRGGGRDYDDRRGGYGGGGSRYEDRRGGGYDDRRRYDDRRGGGYDDRRGGGYGDRHGSYEDRKGGDGGNRYEDRRAPPLE